MSDGFIHLLTFVLDGRRFALRLIQVERVVRAVETTPLPQAPAIVSGAIDVQGRILPVFNLRKRFGLAERAIEVDDQFIIARTSKRQVALAVDRVGSVIEQANQNIVPATAILGGLKQIDGVVRIDDDLTLIHDLEKFLGVDEERALDEALTRNLRHAG